MGGLGCMGVGQMWMDDDGYVGRLDYDEAPGFNSEKTAGIYSWRLFREGPQEAEAYARASEATE